MEQMKIRKACKADIPFIVEMLANDKLGSQREQFEDPLPKSYIEAFEKISSDPYQELLVMEDDNSGNVVGTLQLTFLQYLTYQGGVRAQIEQVRIHESQRNKGFGKKLFEWAIGRAKEKGAHLIQLTTDKKRPEALHFYEDLGFKASHEGMKLHFGSFF
jgi:GNAT superfamily N-acetyltransferase